MTNKLPTIGAIVISEHIYMSEKDREDNRYSSICHRMRCLKCGDIKSKRTEV
jgi:hypothetical protein